ncbi:ABC transporter substrate-binding protein [Vibrio sp. TH_r3]|uniref:ABC transporter substrate-binding protein n=1 Tax=Vibrio sp. TH_r3 TaxID=3082084 RepID=UPI002955DA75|nr:ABC transporter substrate-binding protein [Vibrio sp. TH_r3]MDV7105594.1 ABC transporter substrate-binding protein [Vibrio sp. TH_r3]
MTILKVSVAASMLLASTAVSATETTFLNWVTSEPSNKAVIEDLISRSGQQTNVISSSWGDMQKNVYLRVRTKQPLDVFQSQARWLPTFAQLPNVVDFNEVFGKEFLEANIPPAVLEAGRYEGKQYGMPWNVGSISLVANKKMLDDKKIEVSPATIDEFVATLKAVKKSYPDSTPYAMMTKGGSLISSDFQLWLWAHGGSIFDTDGNITVNSQATVKTLDFMKMLLDEKLASLDVDRGAARRMFGQENTAYYFDATVARGFARDFSGMGEEYDKYVYPIETPTLTPEMQSHSLEWGHVLMMIDNDGAKVDGKLSPESVSAQLIKTLSLNTQVQVDYFTQLGGIPVTNEARTNKDVVSDSYIVNWNKSMGIPKRNELSPLRNSANYVAVVSEEVQSVLLGKKEPQEAALSMEQRIQRLKK